jgi:hypothetical protein
MYGNKIEDSGDVLVKFTVTGEASIITAGTETYRTFYTVAKQGVAQVNIRSTKTTGEVALFAETGQVNVSTLSFTTKNGYPAGMTCVCDRNYVVSDGQDKIRVTAVVRDTNGNIAVDYQNPVLFTISGPGEIVPSWPITPVRGTAAVDVVSSIFTGTITVTATSSNLVPAKTDIITVPEKADKLILTCVPGQVYAGDLSTVTITVIDTIGNIVPVNLSVGLSAAAGRFINSQVQTIDGIGTAVYSAATAGEVLLAGIVKDSVFGEQYITVLPSTKPVAIEIITSTVVYVPANRYVKLTVVDMYGNRVTGVNKNTVLAVTNSANETIVSTTIRFNNGETEYPILLTVPDVYYVNATAAGLTGASQKIYCFIDKTVANNITVKHEYGDIKVSIPAGMLDKNVILKVVKHVAAGFAVMSGDSDKLVSATAIELVAKDINGNTVPVTVSSTGFITLTMPYPDVNNDGIVDGTNIFEQNLKIAKLIDNRWQVADGSNRQLSTVNRQLNSVSCPINQLGTYAITGSGLDPVIENVVVYPNPFKDSTLFSFNVGAEAEITVGIYSIAGRLLRTITKQTGQSVPGLVSILYDGETDTGDGLANGTYLFKIKAKNPYRTCTKTGELTVMR